MEIEGYTKREEEYLEAIYLRGNGDRGARIVDLSRELKVSPPSVVGFLRKLERKGLIIYEKGGCVRLTEEGLKVAKRIHERHLILEKFLVNVLGVSLEVAERDACQIEHVIHPETLSKIARFTVFVQDVLMKKKSLQELYKKYMNRA